MKANTARLKKLRHELLREREVLANRERRDFMSVREDGAAEKIGDEMDLSLADLQADLDLALLQIRAEALQHVDGAIARIDEGDYGLCVDCGVEIPVRRLQALPFAERCVVCEERRESRRAAHLPRRGAKVASRRL